MESFIGEPLMAPTFIGVKSRPELMHVGPGTWFLSFGATLDPGSLKRREFSLSSGEANLDEKKKKNIKEVDNWMGLEED